MLAHADAVKAFAEGGARDDMPLDCLKAIARLSCPNVTMQFKNIFRHLSDSHAAQMFSCICILLVKNSGQTQ